MADLQDEVLMSLRRIIRATSLHSRQLGKDVGLTTPQLVVMRAIGEQGLSTASQLARAVSLSQATITTIIDRLEAKQLVTRERSTEDRRRVQVQLTETGRQALQSAPKPLQERFSARFVALPEWQQYQIVAALKHVATMMDAEELDAAPLLASSDDVY